MTRVLLNALLYTSLILAGSVFAVGQTTPDPKRPAPPQPQPTEAPPAAPQPCPKITVTSVTQPVREGTPVKFTATVAGGDGKTAPIYSWTITSGVISSGQGTPIIDVDTGGTGADKSITASASVIGFPPECGYEASATVTVAGPAKKIDEYSTIKEEDENAKFDTFVTGVTPTDQAMVVVYAGRTSPRGYASSTLKRIRAYLLKAGAPGDRLITIDGGFKEQPSHELWIVPIGAEVPRPAPTINARDIVYPKPTPPVKKP